MLIFREPTDSDYALVVDSFWRSASSVPSCHGLGRLILVGMLEKVIANPAWNVTIMADDGAPDEILCWAVYRKPTELFWLSVKPRYSRLGFARSMLEYIGVRPGLDLYCPILPPYLLAVAGKHGLKLHHRPYLALT